MPRSLGETLQCLDYVVIFGYLMDLYVHVGSVRDELPKNPQNGMETPLILDETLLASLTP